MGKNERSYFKLCKLRYIRLFTGEYPRLSPIYFLQCYLLRIRFIFTSVVLDVSFIFVPSYVVWPCLPSYGKRSQARSFKSPLAGRQHATLIGAYQLLNDFCRKCPGISRTEFPNGCMRADMQAVITKHDPHDQVKCPPAQYLPDLVAKQNV